MEFLRHHLCDDRGEKDDSKDRGADGVPKVHRHGYGIAAGLTERRTKNLDDPEGDGDRSDFAEFGLSVHELIVLGRFHCGLSKLL
jgi:hypothetical protein